ncbi:MAG: M3 family oligoendopeptidase [Candidatus Eisenbacteria bacterium]|nr:M3 family metallopeptidase [Candidatus Eisenbacteria bacterium]
MIEITAADQAQQVRWDLRPIYAGPKDPKIAKDEAEVDRLVASFQEHRGKLKSAKVTARQARAALEQYEKIRFLADRLVTYAHLAVSADAEDSTLCALLARLEERHSLWLSQTVFAELEYRRLPAAAMKRLLQSPLLAPYRHWLAYQGSLAPHTLSEAEEKLALKKDIAGRNAIVRFREEFAARLDFGTLLVGGQERKMSFGALISLQESPDPDVRLRSRERLLETFADHKSVFSFLYSSVVKDHGIEAEMRRFEKPIDVENIPNEIPGEVVENLLRLWRKHLPDLHGYYAWRKGRMGLPSFRSCDLTAPLPGVDPKPIPWEQTRGLVEGAFARIDPSFGTRVSRFFEEGRLDAGARQGKRGGAFCAPVPGREPYVLLSYTGTWNSLVTLAHELGHGIHFSLSGESQCYLQAYRMSKVIAETASEFGECLLRDHLLETREDPDLRRQILSSEVDRFIGVVFRQLLFTQFERDVHERSKSEPLTCEALCDLWMERNREQYGPDVELLPQDRFAWAFVGHFVFNPFYCYSYALSQVVVLALYRKWKREGNAFVPAFVDLLRSGWSDSPVDLLAKAGIDLRDPRVLEEAFLEFRDRVRDLKEAMA